MKKIKLLDKDSMSKIVIRLAHEIVENNKSNKEIAIVGIRTRGDIIAKRVCKHIKQISNQSFEVGTLDVTFYRDDFSSNWGSPKVGPSDITFDACITIHGISTFANLSLKCYTKANHAMEI